MLRLLTFGGLRLTSSEGEPAPGLSQRRRLALLAFVASAGSAGVSRERVLAHLWPDSDLERARHALAQLVYSLRRSAGGANLVVGDTELRLDPASVTSDVGDFLAALSAGEPARAAACYAGSFLEGVHLPEAPEFERWLETERRHLATLAWRALDAVAREGAAVGDVEGVAEARRRQVQIEPYDAPSNLAYMEALAACGRREAALSHARTYERLVRAELELEPDPRIGALADRLRAAPPMPSRGDPAPAPGAGAATPAIAAAPAAQAAPEPAAATTEARRRFGTRRWLAALPAVALVAFVALAAARRSPRPPAELPIDAIAVLPFANLSGDPANDYLSDGVTEDLISRLSQVDGLRVAARTSSFAFRGRAIPVQEIGRALQVGAVVEGSFRREGDTVRVVTRLVHARSGFELWSRTYDRPMGNLLHLQDEVALAVASQLRRELRSPARPAPAAMSAPALHAYTLTLRARYAWHLRSEAALREAIVLFDSARVADPANAAALAGLASAWLLLPTYGSVPPREAYPRARAAADSALALDPQLAEARAVSALLHELQDWDWVGAEREFAALLEQSPNTVTARHWRALNLLVLGRAAEARAEVRVAARLDPLAPSIGAAVAAVDYFAGMPDSAAAAARRLLASDSLYAPARNWLGLALLERGDTAEALRQLELAVAQSERVPVFVASLAYARARLGHADSAHAELARLRSEVRGRYLSPVSLALVHAALGERDEAFRLLAQAREARDPGLLTLACDPKARVLAGDPRYASLLATLGLPRTP